MQITVNGETRSLAEGLDVAGLVAELGLTPDGIAVAVDHAVVARGRWQGRTLDDGAQVDIVTAMQGG